MDMKNTNPGIELSLDDFYDPVGFQVAYLNQKPHKKQIEVLRSPHKNKIIVCGRRSGKTQMIAGEIIRGGILKLYMRQMVVAPTYKQTLIVFYKITELMDKAGVYGDIDKVTTSPRPKIIFKTGAFVDFGSADNPDTLRGEAYDRMFKDESAFIKEGAKNAIKPLTYDTGAPIWETTTPWGKGEVWELWERGLKGDEDYGCFHYNYLDNPYISDEGKKEIEKDIEEYGDSSTYVQCEIYGNFVEDRDRYFKKEEIENCLEEYNLPELPKPRCNYFCGNDIAGEGEDESVFISVLGQNGFVRVVDISNYEKNKPREVVGKDMELYKIYKYQRMCLDKTGIGEGPSDWLKEELDRIGACGDAIVEGIRFTMQSKLDMYSNLKKLMNQGKIKFPMHKKLIYQLLDLRYELTSSGGMKLHHPENKFDDYPDALALACWACIDDISYKPMLS
jgi:hypothetical protein